MVSFFGLSATLQLDGVGLLVTNLDAQAAPFCGDCEIAIAEAPHEIERLARRLLEREPKRVVLHVLLDGRAHVRRGAEIPVGRHQPLDPLMRALEVVRIDEERETACTIGEVREDRSRQEFLPKRLPKALDLSERLRVLRSALDVSDPLAPQLLFEIRLATPRRVLAALIRQDLLRRPVVGYPALQRLHHQHRALMVSQSVRHDEARVVVHEGRQVQALMPSQQKREDVRLPKLIGCRALEATRRVLARTRLRQRLGD
jgi:hypothetical protein